MSHLSPAERTAATLLAHRADGRVAMIPGAFEVRAAPATVLPARAAESPVVRDGHAAAPPDRERLEHEREGGGAPSQRDGKPSGMLSRLWQTMWQAG